MRSMTERQDRSNGNQVPPSHLTHFAELRSPSNSASGAGRLIVWFVSAGADEAGEDFLVGQFGGFSGEGQGSPVEEVDEVGQGRGFGGDLLDEEGGAFGGATARPNRLRGPAWCHGA